jgi:epoxyqueuosine reductase
MEDRPRLLLHVCCGPCATVALERLLPEYEVVALWYNPNIQPAEEHDLRLAGALQVTQHFGVEMALLPRDEADWLEAVRGLEEEPEGGKRCAKCFRHRIARAVREAGEGFSFVSTTLTVGPSKPAQIINGIGRAACAGTGLQFVEADFKLQNGFARSVELSRSLGIYRQRYCGCAFAVDR